MSDSVLSYCPYTYASYTNASIPINLSNRMQTIRNTKKNTVIEIERNKCPVNLKEI